MREYLERPGKEAIRALPPFQGFAKDKIILVNSRGQLRAAELDLSRTTHVGFDTESKPVFQPNLPKTGPHLIQIATDSTAYLFPVTFAAGLQLVRAVVSSETVTKVGFGLKSDREPIKRLLGAKIQQGVELSVAVQRLGYRQKVGLQSAVAIVLGQYLQKSKKVTTSNWASTTLTPAQLQYAANDALASLRIFKSLEMTAPQLLARQAPRPVVDAAG